MVAKFAAIFSAHFFSTHKKTTLMTTALHFQMMERTQSMFCTISGGGGTFAKPPDDASRPAAAAAAQPASRKTSRSIMKASASTEGTLDTSGEAGSSATPAKKHRKQSSYKRSLSLNAKLHNNVKTSGSFADIALANYHSCEYYFRLCMYNLEQASWETNCKKSMGV